MTSPPNGVSQLTMQRMKREAQPLESHGIAGQEVIHREKRSADQAKNPKLPPGPHRGPPGIAIQRVRRNTDFGSGYAPFEEAARPPYPPQGIN